MSICIYFADLLSVLQWIVTPNTYKSSGSFKGCIRARRKRCNQDSACAVLADMFHDNDFTPASGAEAAGQGAKCVNYIIGDIDSTIQSDLVLVYPSRTAGILYWLFWSWCTCEPFSQPVSRPFPSSAQVSFFFTGCLTNFFSFIFIFSKQPQNHRGGGSRLHNLLIYICPGIKAGKRRRKHTQREAAVKYRTLRLVQFNVEH